MIYTECNFSLNVEKDLKNGLLVFLQEGMTITNTSNPGQGVPSEEPNPEYKQG